MPPVHRSFRRLGARVPFEASLWSAAILAILILACGGGTTVKYSPGQSGPAASFTFDQDPVGKLPDAYRAFTGSWQVREEPGTPSPPNALCQTGKAEFPAIQLTDAVYTDLTLSARFKTISGREDQAGGLIFRIQDQSNYYILRANALEGNVNLYKYVGGQRSEIKGGSAQVRAGQWQELKVEVRGRHLRGSLDGRLVVEADDETFKAGKVGLWTKADSVTCFDDVAVAPA